MKRPRPALTRTDAELIAHFKSMRTGADVADLLEVPRQQFSRLVRRWGDRERYRVFEVAKRNGGTRQIAVPPRTIRRLQAKLNYILQLCYRPKPAVHGFKARRSIKSNAIAHVGRKWVFNIDLESFFPSIHLGRIRGAFMAKPFLLPEYAATALAQLVTMSNGVLPQGAPTSPFISNIVCSRLDGQLMALANQYHMIYTRYCDDITFSTRQSEFPLAIAFSTGGWLGIHVTLGEALGAVISNNGFVVNQAKTRLQLRNSHQEVTGLVVNEFMNVSRGYVRQLRTLLHGWSRYGKESAASYFAARSGRSHLSVEREANHFGHVLRGRIEYVGFVRGIEDPLYCALRNRLHRLEPGLIPAVTIPTRYSAALPRASSDRWQRLQARRESAVGLIEVKSGGDTLMGTAFALDDGTLVTAAHNLKGRVTLNPGQHDVLLEKAFFHSAGRDEVDAAMVAATHGLMPLQVDRRIPERGEAVAILGFASIPGRHPELGIYQGAIESIHLNHARTRTLLQVSMPAAGGLSGSPLLDARGRAIGIVIESAYEDTAAAVPRREYATVLPMRDVLEIARTGAPVDLDP